MYSDPPQTRFYDIHVNTWWVHMITGQSVLKHITTGQWVLKHRRQGGKINFTSKRKATHHTGPLPARDRCPLPIQTAPADLRPAHYCFRPSRLHSIALPRGGDHKGFCTCCRALSDDRKMPPGFEDTPTRFRTAQDWAGA